MHLATVRTTDKDGKQYDCIVAFDQRLSIEEQIVALRSLANAMENGEKSVPECN